MDGIHDKSYGSYFIFLSIDGPNASSQLITHQLLAYYVRLFPTTLYMDYQAMASGYTNCKIIHEN